MWSRGAVWIAFPDADGWQQAEQGGRRLGAEDRHPPECGTGALSPLR